MQQGEAFLTTRSEKESAYIGRVLGELIRKPIVITLKGELGSGKTVFVRGAAAGLGVTEMVTSPSFVLLKIYQGRLPVYHFDFYRLTEEASLEDLAFEEYLPGEGVAFIEWAGNIPRVIPQQHLEITLERCRDQGSESRRLRFIPRCPESSRLVAGLIENITWKVDGSLNMLPHSLVNEDNGGGWAGTADPWN